MPICRGEGVSLGEFVLQRIATYVHADDDDIDGEQLPDHAAGVLSLDHLKELDGLDDVQS